MVEEAKKTTEAAVATVQSERAWVTFSAPRVVQVEESNLDGVWVTDGLGFGVDWRNSGRSPAIEIRGYAVHRVTEGGPPGQFLPENFPPPEEATAQGPGGVFGTPVRYLNDQETARLRNREVRVFLYSLVLYNDIFSPVIRRSETCVEIIHHGRIVPPNGVEQDNITYRAWGPQNTAT
jgi:hypothetical protein